jgi:hypothetical protein
MDINKLKENPEQIAALITLLQSLLPESDEVEQKTEITTSKPVSDIHRQKNTEPRQNKFSNMPEFRMHKEDIEIDKKLAVNPRTPRERDPSMVTLRCRVCGKNEKVSSGLVMSPDRYKCNNCAGKAG